MTNLVLQLRKLSGIEVVASRAHRRVMVVVAFALLTALSAYVAVPIPGTQVPVTLQTLVVILSGALLGPGLGAAAQATYLTAGMLGAPVFSGGAAGLGWLFGPTGGYLLAFPAAAAVVGVLAGRGGTGGVLAAARLGVALLAGVFLIFAGGAAQLAILTGDAAAAIRLGVVPFLVGEAAKLLAALAIAARLRNRTLELV